MLTNGILNDTWEMWITHDGFQVSFFPFFPLSRFGISISLQRNMIGQDSFTQYPTIFVSSAVLQDVRATP